jgi:cytosine deaminase
VEAIRLRATRLKVYRQGKLLAESPAATASLHVPGRPSSTAFMTGP